MANRLYSFRFPADIRSTLEPWRYQLGNQFDEVVAHLADRDRALEDHVNLSVGQGYLGIGTADAIQTGLTTADTAVTGLTVTVEVPANRRLKITVHTMIDNQAAGVGIGVVKVHEDGVTIAHRESYLEATGGLQEGADIDFASFAEPSAGAHTYSVVAGISSNNGRIIASATRLSYISVEDVGPVTA